MKRTLAEVVMLMVMIAAIFFSVNSCNDYKHQLNVATTNIVALNDTIHTVKLDNDQLVYHTSVLQGEMKDMKKLNDSLFIEMKGLKKQLKLKTDIISGTHIDSYVDNG